MDAMRAGRRADRLAIPMISLPFRRTPDPTIGALYGMIVAQARSPAFYRGYGVPDTVAGRMDMIVLHLVLVLRRLREISVSRHPLGQDLFDLFCRDMDDNFREMGVGDLRVPKEMRRVAEAFYGRAKAYDTALDAGDEPALVAALARNLMASAEPTLGARRLAAYVGATVRHLATQEIASGAGATIAFLDPESIAQPAPQDQSVP